MVAYTPNKGLPQPTVNSDIALWGTEVNQGSSILDNNLGGVLSLDVAGNANVTLTSAQAQNFGYVLSGALTGNIDLAFPAVGSFYIVSNQTSGAFTITALTSATGSTGIVCPQGYDVMIWSDGTNIYGGFPPLRYLAASYAPISVAAGLASGLAMPTITDCNSASLGWAHYASTTLNTPVASTYGIVRTTSTDGNAPDSSNGLFQLAFDTGNDPPYYRSNINNGGWSAWTQIANASGNAAITFSVADATTAHEATSLGQIQTSYAPLLSPGLLGTPTAPTAAPGTNTTQLATTAFVQAAAPTTDWAAPGAIGSTTPNTGAFTSLSANAGLDVTGGTVTVPAASIAAAAVAGTAWTQATLTNNNQLANGSGYITTPLPAYGAVGMPLAYYYASTPTNGSTYSIPGWSGSWRAQGNTAPSTGGSSTTYFPWLFQRVA